MKCDGCSKNAVFRTVRKDKIGYKDWCSGCFAKKAVKYEMEVKKING